MEDDPAIRDTFIKSASLPLSLDDSTMRRPPRGAMTMAVDGRWQ
jgi:hypothetical protein